MKEIEQLILKEKEKKNPNKKYIQFLQQISDKKELSEYFVREVKQQNFLEGKYRQNIMEMDDWFKYSGKTEEDSKEYKNLMHKTKADIIPKKSRKEYFREYWRKRSLKESLKKKK